MGRRNAIDKCVKRKKMKLPDTVMKDFDKKVKILKLSPRAQSTEEMEAVW